MTTLHTLIDQLNHPDRNLRSNAALSLGGLDERGALDALLDALGREQELLIREDITWSIVRHGETAIEPLIALLSHADGNVRHHAAHVLGKLRTPRAIQGLSSVLHDENPTVIQKAAFSLGQIGDVAAIPALVGVLGHTHVEVRTMLIKVLEGFGEASVPSLLEAAQSPSWQTREQAIDILGQIGGDEVWATIFAALTDAHSEVRFSAVNAVGHLGNRTRIAATLKPMVNDPDTQVSNLAIEILERLTQTRKPKMPSL